MTLTKYILGITAGLLLLTSCKHKEIQGLVGSSHGPIDEVIFVIDNDRYKTTFSDSLITFFMEQFPGVPTPQPYVDFRIKSYQQLMSSGDILKDYRNIVFCSTLDRETPVAKLIRSAIGTEGVAAAVTDTTYYYGSARDMFTNDQYIGYLFAPSEDELYLRLGRGGYKTVAKDISRSETPALLKKNLAVGSGANNVLRKKIQERFGFDITFANAIREVESDSGYIKVAGQTLYKDGSGRIIKELLMQSVIKRISKDSLDNVAHFMSYGNKIKAYPIHARNKIGREHVHGKSANYPMTTDVERPIIQDWVTIGGKRMLETRGLWRMKNPFRGGAFLNYCFEDGDEFVIIDCFVFCAGLDDKRLYIRQMEAYISSINFEVEA